MNIIELTMYEIARLFLMPVLLIISAMFIFSFFSLGAFLVEALQRRHPDKRQAVCRLRRAVGTARPSSETLQLTVLRLLEPLRVTTRVAPMLGLIATMIPLTPALLALGEGNLSQVGENLVVAFAAVIIALIAASISFMILTVRRRWLLDSLHALENEGAVQ